MGSNEYEVTGEPISREQASSEGRVFFFTGKPCVRGHLVRRYVSTGACARCLKQSRESVQRLLKAKRMQRGATQTWAFFEVEPAQMPTAIATLKMLGCTVKGPITPGPHVANWKPPPELVNPVITQTVPVRLQRQASWQEAPDRSDETVDESVPMMQWRVPPPPLTHIASMNPADVPKPPVPVIKP